VRRLEQRGQSATVWMTVLAVSLAFISSVTSVPQMIRIVRTRDVAGLNVTTQGAWALSWAVWLVYSYDIAAWPKFGAEVLGLVVDTTVLVVLVRYGTEPVWSCVRRCWWVVPSVAVLAWVWQVHGTFWLAIGLGVFDAVAVGPQLISTLKSSDLSGLSLWSWGTRCFVYSGWIAYAMGISHPEACAFAYAMLPVSLVVVYRVSRQRRRQRDVALTGAGVL
jgi:uncharacterized protein with PQ loop repeat